jgi:signal transduction histidine kinase
VRMNQIKLKLPFNFKNFQFNEKTTIYFLTIIFLCLGLMDLLPYFCQYQFSYDDNNNQFASSLQSNEYLNSMVFVIGLSIPLFLDIMIDLRFISFNLLLPRILIVCGCLITHLIFYFSLTSPSSSSSITLFIGLYRIREYLIAGGLIIFLFQTQRSKYDQIIGTIILVTGVAYNLLLTWSDVKTNSILKIIIFCFRILLGIELLTLCLWYMNIVRQELSEIMSSKSMKLTLIYTIILAFFFFLLFVIWFIFGSKPWENISIGELVAYNILEACTMLGAIIIPARLARFETHANEIELIRKRIFVRYVSHEVRTPLNAISVGLELVTAALNSIEKSFHSSLLSDQRDSNLWKESTEETSQVIISLQSLISDISQSCSSSIDILDDLLLFDNIENGEISLRKQCVPIISCIERWAKPFRLQVISSLTTPPYYTSSSGTTFIHHLSLCAS